MKKSFSFLKLLANGTLSPRDFHDAKHLCSARVYVFSKPVRSEGANVPRVQRRDRDSQIPMHFSSWLKGVVGSLLFFIPDPKGYEPIFLIFLPV